MALPNLQRLVDRKLSIQNGVSTCKSNAGPGSGCIKKDDPFPAMRGARRLNDIELDGFVIHNSHSRIFSYPNAYWIEAVMPAAMRHATAASVQTGRALRETRRIKASVKSAILLHQLSDLSRARYERPRQVNSSGSLSPAFHRSLRCLSSEHRRGSDASISLCVATCTDQA